jgi:hypothetical protein
MPATEETEECVIVRGYREQLLLHMIEVIDSWYRAFMKVFRPLDFFHISLNYSQID